MQHAIIEVAAERIAAALIESDDVDASSVFSETLTQMIAEPVAATLRSIEQTRDALAKAMDVVASASSGDAPEELPKPTGMPMMDVNEISQRIVVEKPRLLSLLGKGVLASYVQRKLETQYDRALLEFLSLYANRLRRWRSRASTRCATRLMNSLICIARTLMLRRQQQGQPTRQLSKTIFGFCANGKKLPMRCPSARGELRPLRGRRIVLLTIGNCGAFT